jgi:hypothetical protein
MVRNLTFQSLRGHLLAWLLLRLKQPHQIWCLVISKTLFNFGGAHANSRFACEFGEAAPGCFLKFCGRVHSAIHLHCSSLFFFFFSVCIVFVYFFLKKKLVLHCHVNNIFFSRKTSIERIKFTRTVISNQFYSW